MAKIWRNRIIAGDREYSAVPSSIKNDVLNLLKQDVANGVISAERFKEITGEDYDG